MKPIDEQMAILMQGVEFGDEEIREVMTAELRERLARGRPLRVYCGYDPTAPDIHLGHTVTMNKLHQFQELGHQVTFLIGTFTGQIGDPSDRNGVRKQQAPEAAMEHARTYAEQAFKILDRERTQVRHNGEWLARLTFAEVIEGRADVRAVFSAGKGAKAAGAYVTEGKIVRNASARVIRAGKQLAESPISSLKRFKDDAREVATGYECGIGLKDFNDFEVGDILETFRMEQVK